MLRKIFNIFIILVFTSNLFAQSSIIINPKVYDFGIVAKWKNDTAFFEIENSGGQKFLFLPIGYSQDIQVILPRNYINVGERATVKLIYFTHSRGNFRKDVKVYISSLPEPINIAIKGKIIDFHPDAMMDCPTLGEEKPKIADSDIEVEVIDAINNKGLTGFNILLKNNAESRLIEISPKSKVKYEKVRNGKYKLNVSLSGYETKEEEIFVTKTKKKFVVKLMPSEEPLFVKKDSINKESDGEIIIEKDNEKENEEIEKLRKKYDEIYKNKKIIEKDVILIKESDNDSSTVDSIGFIPDFDNSGKLNKNKFANNNIVFLIDVSGSMDKPEKLPLLKKSVIEMVKVLRDNDLVTIITYAGKVKILLQAESGQNKEKIYATINSLEAKGQSYGSEGMNMAYDYAKRNFIENGNNQVILVSDGLFNSEDFSPKKIYKLAKEQAQNNKIITSSIGFGKNEDAINFLQNIAKNGMGNFIVIKSETQANTALIQEIMKNSLKK